MQRHAGQPHLFSPSSVFPVQVPTQEPSALPAQPQDTPTMQAAGRSCPKAVRLMNKRKLCFREVGGRHLHMGRGLLFLLQCLLL